MKINNILKIFVIIMILVMGSVVFCQVTECWTPDWGQFDNAEDGEAGNAVTNIMGAAINIISIVGAGIAIIMLIVIGIGYVTKSPEGKADAKKGLTSYIVGAVLLFATSGILKLVQMFIDENVNKI